MRSYFIAKLAFTRDYFEFKKKKDYFSRIKISLVQFPQFCNVGTYKSDHLVGGLIGRLPADDDDFPLCNPFL